MRRNPFLDFQITAERAGYPALLIVSLLCLALVVVPVALLALTEAVWVLAVALLSLIGAVAILSAGFGAAFADRAEPDSEPSKPVPATDERRQAVPLRPERTPTPRGRTRPQGCLAMHTEKTNRADRRRELRAVNTPDWGTEQDPRGSDAVRFDVQGSTSPRRIA